MACKWRNLLLGVVAVLTGAYLAGSLANNRSQERFYAQIANEEYPKRSYYMRVKNGFETEPVHYEIPFGLHSIAWKRLNQHLEMRIEFAGNFDLSSPDSRRYGYALEIVDRKRRLILWYGHNVGHSAVGALEMDEVALVDVDDRVVVAKGHIHFEGRTALVQLQGQDFNPDAVYLFYTPSREALEEGGLHLVSSWVAERLPWGNRVFRLSGKYRWRHPVESGS